MFNLLDQIARREIAELLDTILLYDAENDLDYVWGLKGDWVWLHPTDLMGTRLCEHSCEDGKLVWIPYKKLKILTSDESFKQFKRLLMNASYFPVE